MKQISTETGICFFRVTEPTSLLPFLHAADFSPLAVNKSEIDHWLNLGCVYVDGQRIRANLDLNQEQVIRLHTRPKHYFDTSRSLKPLIIEENLDFLVLDKPAGLPTHPTLDNYVENAKVLLERELGIPLFTTHRLDIPTQGLLILAKTSKAQVVINRLFSEGRVKKVYRSIQSTAVELGTKVHYMNPEARVPKIVSLDPHEGWWRCELHVDEVREGGGVQMTLLTGKTHQIRAQMKALGSPILGDVIYGGPPRAELALECYQMEFQFRSTQYSFTKPNSLWNSL